MPADDEGERPDDEGESFFCRCNIFSYRLRRKKYLLNIFAQRGVISARRRAGNSTFTLRFHPKNGIFSPKCRQRVQNRPPKRPKTPISDPRKQPSKPTSNLLGGFEGLFQLLKSRILLTSATSWFCAGAAFPRPAADGRVGAVKSDSHDASAHPSATAKEGSRERRGRRLLCIIQRALSIRQGSKKRHTSNFTPLLRRISATRPYIPIYFEERVKNCYYTDFPKLTHLRLSKQSTLHAYVY